MIGLFSKPHSKYLFKGVVAALLISQLTACGTILYPERRGQASGSIDAGVAVLDAVGLLFFFIPGVVAFGVDFATGAIYLPGGKMATLTPKEMDKVKNNGNQLDMVAFKKVIAERSGLSIKKGTDMSKLQAVSMSSKQALLAALNIQTPNQQVAQAAVYR